MGLCLLGPPAWASACLVLLMRMGLARLALACLNLASLGLGTESNN